MECYICTDITEEKSPCECQAPVHMKCLHQWIKKVDNNRLVCSICNRDLKGIEIEPILIEHTRRRNRVKFDFKIFCFRFGYFILMGYVGKLLFALMSFTDHPYLMLYPTYWIPFDLLFMLCAALMMAITAISIPLVMGICEYISACKSNNYEEFIDSDTDSITNGEDDSIV